MARSEHTRKVEALVMRHSDWGEADRLLVIFSPQQGKTRVVAKGIRRLRSRKAGHLEPFTRVSLLLARGRDLWIVTQAETIEAFLPLRENLVLTSQAAYVVELLDRFTYDEGPSANIYRLVVETLQRLSSGDDPFLVLRYYDIHLLDQLGFRPRLFHCVRCNQDIKPVDQYFSAQEGGVICPTCGLNQAGLKPVSMSALKILRHYQRSSYNDARRAVISLPVQIEVEALLNYYLTYLLERGLNAPRFLREVRPVEGQDIF
jgi:DNA repair protein RecO (recombination protein O)